MTKSTAYTNYTRKSWPARPPRATSPQGNPVEGFLHHSEDKRGDLWDTLAKQQGKVRTIQDFHMDGRGWSDIAYHFVIFQPNRRHTRAHIFAARDIHAEPAAQLDHNMNTLAICVVGNGDVETLHPHTRTAIRAIIHAHPTVKKLGGHRDVTPTDCPGGLFYREVPKMAAILGIAHF